MLTIYKEPRVESKRHTCIQAIYEASTMKVFILAVLIAVTCASPPVYRPAYKAPVYQPAEYKPEYPEYKSEYPAPSYKAAAEYPAPSYKAAAEYPAPSYKPAYNKPSYETYEDKPLPYNFAWGVKDEYYNDFAQEETADGKGYVSGSYRVALPDGRTQTVHYKDEGYGLIADVKYEGEPKYDSYKPKAIYPAPAAYAAPAYPKAYPAPAYKEYPSYEPKAYPSPSYDSYPKY